MKEIEVKIELDNADQVASKLKELGCQFSEPVIQDDRIFIPNGTSLPANRGVNVLRLRKQQDKFILTLKQALTGQLDCIERETAVSDPEQTILMFKDLGFYEVARVTKERTKTKFNELEICLDKVEKLGTFIEVEKLVPEEGCDDKKSLAVQTELLEFLSNLGLDLKKRVNTGYDNLLIQRGKI
jgi:adenylate cyclase, class 2